MLPVNKKTQELEETAPSMGEEMSGENELASSHKEEATTTTTTLTNSVIARNSNTSVLRSLVKEVDWLEKDNQNLRDQNIQSKHGIHTELEGTLCDAFDASTKRHGQGNPKAITDAALSIYAGGIAELVKQ